MKFFGAVYVGTYAISMRIFEVKKGSPLITVESVSVPMRLEEELIDSRHLSPDTIDDVCRHINEFKEIIETYRCDDCRVYTNPAFFRLSDSVFIRDSIKRNCGLDLTILSNSEHRLLTYKRLTAHPEFANMAGDGCAIVNIGGGDTQITVVSEGDLMTTEHISMGAVILYDSVKNIPENESKKRMIMTELIDKQLNVIKGRRSKKKLNNLILMGDYARETYGKTKEKKESIIDAKQFLAVINDALAFKNEDIIDFLNVSDENAELLAPYMVLYKRMLESMGVKRILVPEIDILDGIGYSYALEQKLLPGERDFESDVLSAARHMADKFMSYSPHIEALVKNSTLIFDAMSSEHDMGSRELLLLKCAAILHDIGKFISLTGSPTISFDIIMASEILGLSHRERFIVASIVKYNATPLISFPDSEMDEETYLIVSRCAAIMRLANVIDRSHKQKFENITVRLSDDKKLIIAITSEDDLLLEKSMFGQKIDTFKNVFSITPVLKHKKKVV